MKRPSFERLAPWYPLLEFFAFGSALTTARNTALDWVAGGNNILLLGEGNGRFLTDLLVRNPHAHITCVEPCQRMRILTNQRLVNSFGEVPASLRIIPNHVEDWLASGASDNTYDRIVTHFVLDLFDDSLLSAILSQLNKITTQDALWCIAEFQLPASGWRRINAMAIIKFMYLFFFLTTGLQTKRLPQWRTAMESAGWHHATIRESVLGMVVVGTFSKGVQQCA